MSQTNQSKIINTTATATHQALAEAITSPERAAAAGASHSESAEFTTEKRNSGVVWMIILILIITSFIALATVHTIQRASAAPEPAAVSDFAIDQILYAPIIIEDGNELVGGWQETLSIQPGEDAYVSFRYHNISSEPQDNILARVELPNNLDICDSITTFVGTNAEANIVSDQGNALVDDGFDIGSCNPYTDAETDTASISVVFRIHAVYANSEDTTFQVGAEHNGVSTMRPATISVTNAAE